MGQTSHKWKMLYLHKKVHNDHLDPPLCDVAASWIRVVYIPILTCHSAGLPPTSWGMLNNKMTCFNSSDPAAKNATLLFDLDNDNENLWTRSNNGGPLPLCSSPSSPPDSPCGVCFDQMVYVVCRNLTDGVKMMMEAGGVPVDLSKSNCPKPPSDGDGGASKSQLLAIIIPIIILLLLLIMVLLYIFRKELLKFFRAIQCCCRQRPETEKSEESVTLKNGTY